MELYGKGLLAFPEDVIVVFADYAPESHSDTGTICGHILSKAARILPDMYNN